MNYTIDIDGMKRDLKLYPANDKMQIAAFLLFEDVEITKFSAERLLEKAPPFDLLLTAEAKSIPLIYEMARQAGMNEYIVARKGIKVYMEDVLSVSVHSITTENIQKLYLSSDDVNRIKGKRILIVDDVISTGESLAAMERIVAAAGGEVAGRMAILAEGNAYDREDIIVLGKMPLFDKDGNVL